MNINNRNKSLIRIQMLVNNAKFCACLTNFSMNNGLFRCFLKDKKHSSLWQHFPAPPGEAKVFPVQMGLTISLVDADVDQKTSSRPWGALQLIHS